MTTARSGALFLKQVMSSRKIETKKSVHLQLFGHHSFLQISGSHTRPEVKSLRRQFRDALWASPTRFAAPHPGQYEVVHFPHCLATVIEASESREKIKGYEVVIR
jgi:hypothetical protein